MKNLIFTTAIAIISIVNGFAANSTDLENTDVVEIVAKKKRTVALDANFGIEEKFMIYTNPKNDDVTVDFNNQKESFQLFIYNENGQLISFIENTTERLKIETDSFKAGNYFIKVKNNDGYNRTTALAIF